MYPLEEDFKDYHDTSNMVAVEEEVFCICQKVTQEYEMIKCDNDTCKYQWFHFSCVGIKIAPEGKWFCPDCLKARQKKKKR